MSKVSKGPPLRTTGRSTKPALVSDYRSTLETASGDWAGVEREHVAERLKNHAKPRSHSRRMASGHGSFLDKKGTTVTLKLR